MTAPSRATDPIDGYGDATDEDLVATIDTRTKEMRDRRSEWIKEAEICYGFVAAHQWSDEDQEVLKAARRPTVTIPLVGPVIDVVAGLEVTNRQEVQYLPRELGDAGPNEVLTGAGQWTRDECNAEDEESEAFLDMATCGEGWTETRLDYEYDADGMILTERVDPFEMLPDDRSIKKNYRDAEDIAREKMVSLLWVKETWPEKANEIEAWEATAEDKEFQGESHITVAGDQWKPPNNPASSARPSRGQVKLIEYQYKKRVPFYRIADPQTGEMAEFSPAEHKQIQERAEAILGQKLKSVRQTKCVHHRAFKVGPVLLERNECPDPNSFTYKAMTAKRDRKKGCWYGVVRPMLDAQRWVNKFFSQSMHILNTNAKGGVIAEKTAFDDQAKFEASWAHSDKVTVVRDGVLAAGRIQPKVPPPFPTELSKLLEFCVAMIYKVSGISPEMLGSVDREQAAVLEYQRKQAGVTILATLFDALRKYRKEQGKNALYLILTYLSDGRLIRIVGKEGAKYVPLLRQSGADKYDVIIDQSPSSPNEKEKTWVILQSLLPILLKAGIPIPPKLLQYLPLPQSLLDEITKPDPAKQQEQQIQKQLQMRGAVAEVEKTESEAIENKARAQLALAQAGNQQQENQLEGMAELGRVQVEREASQHEMQMRQVETHASIEEKRKQTQLKILDTLARLETERAQVQADTRRQDETARANVAIKAETAAAQTEIQARQAEAMAKQKAAPKK